MVFEKIVEIMGEKLGQNTDEITPETKFADMGIDSLDVTEIVMALEDSFEIEIELSDTKLESVSDLVELIDKIKG